MESLQFFFLNLLSLLYETNLICVDLFPLVGFFWGREVKGDAGLDAPGYVDLPSFPLWSWWAQPLLRLECCYTCPCISCALGSE